MRPPRRLARAMCFWPGHLIEDETGVLWRWDGEDFQPLQTGDVCLHADRMTWGRWNGQDLHVIAVDAATIVTVTASRNGREMAGELCQVEERLERGGWTYVLCRPWPEGGEAVEVPIEHVMPVAAPHEFGEGEVPDE
jgi:hypothetical protein